MTWKEEVAKAMLGRFKVPDYSDLDLNTPRGRLEFWIRCVVPNSVTSLVDELRGIFDAAESAAFERGRAAQREADAAALERRAAALEADLPSWRGYLGDSEARKRQGFVDELRGLAGQIRAGGEGV